MSPIRLSRRRFSIDLAVLTMMGGGAIRPALGATPLPSSPTIPTWRPRLQRTMPVVAVVALNSGTELTDFAIPLGVLSASKVAQVMGVSVAAGDVKMFPALRIRTESTIAQFDVKFPDGADYIIVPAMKDRANGPLMAWILAQAAKGSTIVSICNGAMVVASTGLLNGRHATAHWASEGERRQNFPKVPWQGNVRYVADGKFISSAGISASLPVSIALVEAIAGRAKADALAKQYGIGDWNATHDSDAFKNRRGEAEVSFGSRAGTVSIGIAIAEGVDEVALALTADAYSHTTKTAAFTTAGTGDPIRTRHGLLVIPDRVDGLSQATDRVLHLDSAALPVQVLETALGDIEAQYGKAARRNVIRVMEISTL